jgi:hypothetical protein
MLAKKKIHKAMESLQRALDNLEKGEKRIAVGDLNFVKENAQEAIWILIAEIEEENGGLF